MTQLTSKARVKSYLDFSGTGEDSLIDILIELVSARVEDYCDRVFSEETGRIEYPSGGTGILSLKLFPITSITSIHEDADRDFDSGSLVDSTEYYADTERSLVIRKASWRREVTGNYGLNKWLQGLNIIKVVYNGGYTVTDGVTGVPADLQRLVAQQVAYLYDRRRSLGMSSASGGEGSQSYVDDYEFLKDVKAGLQKYRRVTAS